MQAWERYEPDETVYDGHRKVVLKHFQNHEGRVFDFETFEKVGAESVVVLAIDSENNVVIAEQFRVGPEAIMQDLPGGGIAPGQAPEEAARNELLEETGYASEEWTYLGSTYEHPYNNRKRHYFLAINATQIAEPEIEELEDIEVKRISIDKLLDNAKHGRMTDALIVLYAQASLMKLKKGEK